MREATKPASGETVDSEDQKPTQATALEPAKSTPSRRRFFRHAWLVLGGLALSEYLWVAINFLRPRASLAEQGGIVIAGPVERFEPGTVTAFQRGKFYLSRLEAGGFLAISRECTHLGCTVPWSDEDGRFVCPCHSSEYNEKGEVVSPPAPRPLDLFPVRIENNVVKVDTSEPQKRLRFEDPQVTTP